MPHRVCAWACATQTQAIGCEETVLAPSRFISVKSDASDTWYSQHSAGAFPLDPEARGVIRKLHVIAGLISSNPGGVNLERDFKPLPVGVVELKQGKEEAG